MGSKDQIRDIFFQECEDLLTVLQEGLSAMAEPDVDPETIHSVFRAVHSIKGGAGAFGFDELVRFSHEFEGVLDIVRNGLLTPDEKLMGVLWPAYDMLCDQVAAANGVSEVDPVLTDQLIEKLKRQTGEDTPDQADSGDLEPIAFEPIAFEPVALSFDPDEAPDGQDKTRDYQIHFHPDAAMYVNGNETSLLLRELAGLGELQVSCDTSVLPAFDRLDPEESYLKWNLRLRTKEEEDVVREVFEFVQDDATFEITQQVTEGALPAIFRTNRTPEVENLALEPSKNNQIEALSAAADEADNSLKSKEKESDLKPRNGPAEDTRKDGFANPSTIRVDVKRVDRLINLMGELVINQAMLSQCVIESNTPPESKISTGLDELKRLTREAQDSVMAIRAQQIKSLFQRMSRTVREAATATGKTVRMKSTGEMTEVDKTVIEKLADPLTHMIRNAVDHGLETAAERVASGKPPEGTIWLAATHRSGRVLIDVIDDGKGIDREAVRKIALAKGLIRAEDQLTPEETDALLFLPGFSTAKEVSKLSGRGVGMDVVRSAIVSLGGRVSISSSPGKGSKFSISLPLTLAVLDGMVVDIAGQRTVVPITIIVETLLPKKHNIHAIGSSSVVSVRGAFVPIIDVGHVLGFREKLVDATDSVLILAETDDGVRFALAVDGIHDQRQVVIKGLEENYGKVPGIAAATILGDGQIALILDPNDPMFGGGLNGKDIETTLARTG